MPGSMDYARARINMVESQLRPNRIDDRALLDAMLNVPRERFVPKALAGVAYADEDLRLPDGSYLIEPLALARLIQGAQVGREDVVLVLGCATGYAAAVLARLAATVILLVPDEASAARLEPLLDELGADNVVVIAGADPTAGHPRQAPFDVILLTGSVDTVPAALLEQIGEGGRLVAVVANERVGKGVLFTRLHGVVGRRTLFDAQIPRLAGVKREAEFAF
ncbi:MAG: protein-L-isoaspartate O-methyltransferase family protein [Geminicoccaceae bacterium]